ncbi:MAG: nitrilase-related carbon-nitrogen hydrolase [Promethearchaeota archaeon]
MILKIFIIGPGGVLCYSKNFIEQFDMDEMIISGFLSAINSFAKEIEGGEISALIFKNFNFIYSHLIEYDFIFVIVIDKEELEEDARNKINLMKNEFINRYRPYLEKWTGKTDVFEEFDDFVETYIFNPPKILLTGINGVGKTTILDLFPGENLIELDDELTQIIQKPVDLIDMKGIERCIIREFDLEELIYNSKIHEKLIDSVDIFLLVSNSEEENINRTERLFNSLKSKTSKADFYIIANFQDLDTAVKREKIEETFGIKSFEFSAFQDQSKEKIQAIIKEIINTSVLEKQEKKYHRFLEEKPIIITEDQIESEPLDKEFEEELDFIDIWEQIEESRALAKQGEHVKAAQEFSKIASQFKTISSTVDTSVQEEFNAIFYLCKAWESMELAENEEDPEKFNDACELFNEASELFIDNKLKLLAQGNAAFCQALELGSKFDKSTDRANKEEFYPKIKTMLRNAANSYRKAGFESEADWALATSTYFDATWYIIRADEELKLEKKKKLFEVGLDMLKSAAGIFGKAGYQDKEREVLDRFDLVEKEEKILISALNTISEPSFSKTTLDVLSPSIPRKKDIEKVKVKKKVKKKYNLIYKDLLRQYPKIQKREFRVGIAQIEKSSNGDFMTEYYDEKGSGLLGIREDKIELVMENVKDVIENAHENEINILIFPEMAIDLNYGQFLEQISNLAKLYDMYIIPGSFHNLETKQNISMVIGPEGILWEQEKHIPAIIHFENKKFEEQIKVNIFPRQTIVCNTEFGRIAIIICRDFLDMDLRVELKNFEPPIDIIINPAFTPVTADFKAAHFDARRSIYAYCFFVNVAEYGESLIYTPEKERIERIIPPKEENLIYKNVDLFKLRSERKKWEKEKSRQFIQSTR